MFSGLVSRACQVLYRPILDAHDGPSYGCGSKRRSYQAMHAVRLSGRSPAVAGCSGASGAAKTGCTLAKLHVQSPTFSLIFCVEIMPGIL